jgi:benzoyl-CoA 2,3-dioxygenase component B
VVQRTAELMLEHDTDDVTPYGGINLDTVQRYLNLHYSLSLDLFGAEISTNAANYYAAGLKGRFQESARADDHGLHGLSRTILTVADDRIEERAVPALSALNATLRDDYIDDCQKGVDRWNRTLAPAGLQLRLPHVGFNRRVGAFAGRHVTPDGELVSETEWAGHREDWLPTDVDRDQVTAVMYPVREPGRMASWLAPPASGVHAKPVDFEYVRV